MPSQHDLRCFCKRRPLLALYGLDESGQTYIHIKVFKQGRVYGEAVYYGGRVKIRCRECFRWTIVVFRSATEAVLQETLPPEELDTAANVGLPEHARQGNP